MSGAQQRDLTATNAQIDSWLIQGSTDEAVKINEVKDFVARVRKFCPQTEVMAEYFEGEGHGFDNRSFLPKFQGGLAFIRKAWLEQQ